ncbi:MAG: anti-sigma B factor antagonist [Candidatus Omnitrophota bacterium]|jgi:anti-sigma B factor antagonist
MTDNLQIEIKTRSDQAFVVKVNGPVSGVTHEAFTTSVETILAQKPRKVLVDLEACNYVSSVGIGAFFQFRRQIRASGGGLIFFNLQPQIKMVFDVIKALPLECVFSSVQEADQYLDRVMAETLEKQKKQAEQ